MKIVKYALILMRFQRTISLRIIPICWWYSCFWTYFTDIKKHYVH